jgi:SAM-dependent methyltransferase
MTTGLDWQVGIWDRMMPAYEQEIDVRFIPVIDQVMVRSALRSGLRVLDVGTGTGAVALRVAPLVPDGEVIGVDISPKMLDIARQRASAAKLSNATFVEGRAEALPADDDSVDRILASLSLMYALDRSAAAREFARVLRPGGRIVVVFWSGPEQNDIVRFQTMAGKFAPDPPVAGVGPGAMADGQAFVQMLEEAGIEARLETETTGFAFDTFGHAWDVLVGVTTANMDPDRIDEARSAVREAMWPEDGGPRYFSNLTQFVVGELK